MQTDALNQLIKSRRTVEQFKPEPVPEATIVEALEAAIWAPNHHLTQPWRFYLLGPTTRTNIVSINTDLVRHAKGEAAAEKKYHRWSAIPGWLLVTCEKSDDPILEREDYAACCCAIQNLMLTLWAEGIGSKWTSGAVTRDPRLFEAAWIDPAVEFVVGLIWYGYPAQIPEGHRNPLDQSLVRLG